MNLEGLARHPVLVVADADMAVPPHWLTAVTAPLADPAVGPGHLPLPGEAADAGPWSRLAALWIDWQFLPNAALGEAMGRAQWLLRRHHGAAGGDAGAARRLRRPCPACWRMTMRWGSRCGGWGCGWWWRRSCRRM